MNDFSMLAFHELQQSQMLRALHDSNESSLRYGLALSDTEIEALVVHHQETLRECRRVEVGEGILKQLIEVFCDSPYLVPSTYAQTLTELQELFYYFKSEAGETLSDEELLTLMKERFDGEAQGSLDYLEGT
ncbi:MAG: DUF6323 family protein, partial [Pygmaiobacter sp.]